jgi:hypothetical protein
LPSIGIELKLVFPGMSSVHAIKQNIAFEILPSGGFGCPSAFSAQYTEEAEILEFREPGDRSVPSLYTRFLCFSYSTSHRPRILLSAVKQKPACPAR